MNAFDVGLLVVACILVLVGVAKGLVRILIGVAALVAAFALAAQYHRPLGEWLGWSRLPDNAMMLVSYILIFLGVMLLGGLVAFLLRRLLKAAMLGWADRLAGAALGLVAATLAAALLVLPLIAYTPGGSRMLRESVLAPYVVVVADVAAPLVPDDLERLYQERMQDLRQFWQERMFERLDPNEV